MNWSKDDLMKERSYLAKKNVLYSNNNLPRFRNRCGKYYRDFASVTMSALFHIIAKLLFLNFKWIYKTTALRHGIFLIWIGRHIAAFSPRMVKLSAFERALHSVFCTVTIQWMWGACVAAATTFSNGRSIIAIQRAFRKHFKIARTGYVLHGKSIVLEVDTCMITCSAWKKKQYLQEPPRPQKNVQRVQKQSVRNM